MATYEPSGEGGNGALLEGQVTETEPCVAVEDADGTRYVALFAVGDVSVSGATASYAGRELVAGASVSLAGGVVTEAPDGARVPDGCEGVFWMVSPS